MRSDRSLSLLSSEHLWSYGDICNKNKEVSMKKIQVTSAISNGMP